MFNKKLRALGFESTRRESLEMFGLQNLHKTVSINKNYITTFNSLLKFIFRALVGCSNYLIYI